MTIFAPNGFQAFGRQDGGSPTGGQVAYKIDAVNQAAIGFGEPVVLGTGGDAGFIALGDGTTQILGVFYGCNYIQQSDGRTVWSAFWPGPGSALAVPDPANPGGTIQTPVTAYVVDDPAQLYVCQVGTNGAGVVDPTEVGQAFPYLPGTPASVSPIGGSFSNATLGTTATAGSPFRVVGLLTDFVSPSSIPGLDNTVNNFVVVAVNNSVRGQGV